MGFFSSLEPAPLCDKPRVIILPQPRMTDEAMTKAFAGNSGAAWYKALLQLIEKQREDNLLSASRAASLGNHLAMAGGLNVYESLSALMDELDRRVNLSIPE